MRQKINRVGEIAQMNNGQKATIIAYRSSHDIDVQFEDGMIVTNKKYVNFERGKIRNPNSQNNLEAERIGETRIMTDGIMATVVAYRNSRDIDVQFEDGKIRHNTTYSSFIKGNTRHPDKMPMAMQSQRLGEQRTMHNGMLATIIKYRMATDIDIQFEDGAVATNKDYSDFVSGYIRHPNNNNHLTLQNKRVKQSKIMNNGLIATIIDYRGANDIDVQFEDGSIRNGVRYSAFNNGEILHPDDIANKTLKSKLRLRESRIMNNGIRATIIDYRSSQDITVQFEDGSIRDGISYGSFKRGCVATPNQTIDNIKQQRIRETRIMKNGLKATIIAYRKSKDIDVKFEDGYTREHVSYDSFVRGTVLHPHLYSDKYCGEKNMMTCGMGCEIIAYRNHFDIDVRFEDGSMRTNMRYSAFQNGNIQHPDFTNEMKSKQRINTTRTMLNGMTATVIEYNSSKDITVQFADGTIVKNQRWPMFVQGIIANPNIQYQVGYSLQEHALHYYLTHFGFIKIPKRAFRDRGLGDYELDFYHPDKKIAVEYDGGRHQCQNAFKRDLLKNERCHQMGIKLYRIREWMCPHTNEKAIEYFVSKNNKIGVNYYDCKEIIESILSENHISFDNTFIDFIRDEQIIRNDYNQHYINCYAKRRIGKSIWNSREKQMMTIIEYRSSNDIDVQFEDGKIRYNTMYSSFMKGNLRHPDKMYSTSKQS